LAAGASDGRLADPTEPAPMCAPFNMGCRDCRPGATPDQPTRLIMRTRYAWPELLVGIGEWPGVTEATRGMRCPSIGDSHAWTQARPDAAKTIRISGRPY
jgi:hypothetical protein